MQKKIQLIPWITLVILACITGPAQSQESPATRATSEQAPLKWATSWFGNAFSGKTKLMQRQINGFYVAPDGRCYTNSGWDESMQDAAIYKDGDYVGRLPGIHDRNTLGGWGIAGDGDHVFYSAHREVKGEPNIRTWLVGRSTLDGKPAPWGDGNDTFLHLWKSSLDRTDEGAVGEVFGLAVSSSELFVAASTPDKVFVFDKESGEKKREFDCPHPGPIAVAPDGTLWVVQRSTKPGNLLETLDPGEDFAIVQYTSDGKATGKTIVGGRPLALTFNAAGQLMVADEGPRQQIVFYDVSGQPKEVSAFGDKGGVICSSDGKNSPLRLLYPCGVGNDAQGNIYVASRLPVTGCQIRKFTSQGREVWQLFSDEFMNCSDADPASDGVMVYSPRDCYSMDFSKSNGNEATWLGHTMDKFRFPDDPRLHGDGEGSAPQIRRLQGKLFMYIIGEANHISIFKQLPGSLIFAPAVSIQPVRRYDLHPRGGQRPRSRAGDGSGSIITATARSTRRRLKPTARWWAAGGVSASMPMVESGMPTAVGTPTTADHESNTILCKVWMGRALPSTVSPAAKALKPPIRSPRCKPTMAFSISSNGSTTTVPAIPCT